MKALYLWLMEYFSRHRIKIVLVIANMLIGVLLLAASLGRVLPLHWVDVVCVSLIAFFVALYRPVWIFLLLIGLVPYEIVNLAPEGSLILVRPYQWLLLILVAALVFRTLSNKQRVPTIEWKWIDGAPVLFAAAAFVAAFGSDPMKPALKLAVVLASFVALFFVVRLFVRTESAALQLLPFLLSSFLVIGGWSVIQNLLFDAGRTSFEVMAGRPNGSFAEADWLGMYCIFVIAVALGWLYREAVLYRRWLFCIAPLFFLWSGTVVVILSMTRSAWLGCMGMGLFFAFSVVVTFWKVGEIRRAVYVLGGAALTVGAALGVVLIAHLSRFPFFERTLSTAGQQTITIACVDRDRVPERIHVIEELEAYGCQHIPLEAQSTFKEAGFVIRSIDRDDPNVTVRRSIYERSLALIREHPFLGIGWGTVGSYLGVDGRGAALNASNIFLEFWLGSGLLGFLSFSILWFAYGFVSGRVAVSNGGSEIGFAVFFHTAWIGLTVFNVFNSGILLGFFFVFLGLGHVFFDMIRGQAKKESSI